MGWPRPRCTMTDRPSVVLTMDGDVAHLVLSSPPKNELGARFAEDLSRIFAESLPLSSARGMIVRGEGRHFSSGADIPYLKKLLAEASTEVLQDGLTAYAALMNGISDLPFPVIAAMSGCCLGSGLELALACDYRVASTTAVLAAPEVEFGLMPGAGGTVRLPHLVGPTRALELILTGRTVGAQEALEIGLVDALAPRRDLLNTALVLLDRVRGSKKLVR